LPKVFFVQETSKQEGFL